MQVKINGIAGMNYEQIQAEIQQGARFVVYSYCVSLVVITFRRRSDIQFVRAHENRIMRSLPWTLTSIFCGWWGFPWGFIFTPMALYTNFRGGKDVTPEILGELSPWAYSANPIMPAAGNPQPTDATGPRNPW